MSTLEDSVEFINQQPRCPCALILDTSGSMTGRPIEALNAGLQTLRDDLQNDNLAKKRVEIAIVEFNSAVRVVQDFVAAANFQPPTLTASGYTDLVGGINQALDLIQRRKSKYTSNGVPFYRPWAFLITDGKVTEYEQVARRVREDEQNKRIAFFAVGVQGANEECLKNISVREPKMLAGLNFRELFLWLSASMKRVSQSKPGEMVPLEKGTWEAV
ncbi:MAG: hypothetical protein QOD00_4201 [Blastocatellia bacterium]|jgi:uncharacterized protein YegL|nr:hypothetical protein [Blastocatellia bacterium]